MPDMTVMNAMSTPTRAGIAQGAPGDGVDARYSKDVGAAGAATVPHPVNDVNDAARNAVSTKCPQRRI
jgi:hypothetical protein